MQALQSRTAYTQSTRQFMVTAPRPSGSSSLAPVRTAGAAPGPGRSHRRLARGLCVGKQKAAAGFSGPLAEQWHPPYLFNLHPSTFSG